MNIIERWTQSSLILKIFIGLILGTILTQSSLILKIFIGLILGTILGIFVPEWQLIGFIGDIFVSALKTIAPILVFVLVASAICQAKMGDGSKFSMIFLLFLFTNFLAALISIAACYLYPVSIHLTSATNVTNRRRDEPDGSECFSKSRKCSC